MPRPFERAAQVGVIAHYEGVLAAELQHDFREPPASPLVDPAPCLSGASEADEAHAGRLDERRPGLEKGLKSVAQKGGLLAWSEQQEYLKGIREAADGATRGAVVPEDALRRLGAKAA